MIEKKKKRGETMVKMMTMKRIERERLKKMGRINTKRSEEKKANKKNDHQYVNGIDHLSLFLN